MKKNLTLTLLTLFFAAACSSSVKPSHPENRPPVLIQEVSGNYLPTNSKPQFRYPETLKAYALGRRIDKHDPSLMYEGGLVYRVENNSSWNLQPGFPENIPFGGSEPEKFKDNANALKAEIEVKANEQRALYRALKEASDKASGQMDALKVSTQLSRKLLEQNKNLKEKLLQSTAENKKLHADLETLKNQLQSLLKFYQQKQQIKSSFRRTP